MQITWVNHASFITEHGDFRMISDPWIKGRVFNQSWEHLCPTKFSFQDFRSLSHVWFSHEHPDHFFPPNVKAIPEDIRADLKVLYQGTMDHKVHDFCNKLHFKAIIEMQAFEWYDLDPEVKVLNAKVSNDVDSWLIVKTPDVTYVNINDCVFDDGPELRKIAELAGNVDVLFTQFSYAAWAGNEDQADVRRQHALDKIREINLQIEILKPKYVVPFASYVWFCHQDNFYMNDQVNKVRDIYHHIHVQGAEPIVLYPGESWTVGQDHDSMRSIERYEAAGEQAMANPNLTVPPEVSEEVLTAAAESFRETSLELNNKPKLLSYKPCHFYVKDHRRAYSFSFKDGLQRVDRSEVNCDVSLSAQPMKYCFDFTWGWDTLQVSGAFQKPAEGDFQNFMEYQWIGTLNNQGKYMGNVFERAYAKLMGMLTD